MHDSAGPADNNLSRTATSNKQDRPEVGWTTTKRVSRELSPNRPHLPTARTRALAWHNLEQNTMSPSTPCRTPLRTHSQEYRTTFAQLRPVLLLCFFGRAWNRANRN